MEKVNEGWDLLARTVVARRTRLGLTQQDVASAGGPSTASQFAIENGKGGLRASTLTDLDKALRWEPGTSFGLVHGIDRRHADDKEYLNHLVTDLDRYTVLFGEGDFPVYSREELTQFTRPQEVGTAQSGRVDSRVRGISDFSTEEMVRELAKRWPGFRFSISEFPPRSGGVLDDELFGLAAHPPLDTAEAKERRDGDVRGEESQEAPEHD